MKKTIFIENDAQVNRLVCKILRWILVVLPLLFLGTWTGVFATPYSKLIVVSAVAVFLNILPTIFLKCKLPDVFLKYYSVIAIQVVITCMAANETIGIYITYSLAVALSCLYFDKKFTRNIALVGYALMVCGMYFRSFGAASNIFKDVTQMEWFISYTLGMTIEYVAMIAIFIAIARRARRMLEKLDAAEQVGLLLERGRDASHKLKRELDMLDEAMDESSEINQSIMDSTDRTKKNCSHNISFVGNTAATTKKLANLMDEISAEAVRLIENADQTYDSTKAYIHIMNEAVDNVKRISNETGHTKTVTKQLEETSKEVVRFTEIVSQLSAQTNILAINAAIEASRAGEEGRGFAIVANQVGELATASKEAAQNIAIQISEMNYYMQSLQESVDGNIAIADQGVDCILRAREEARKLGDLQEVSKDKVRQIANQCERSKSHSNDIAKMTQQVHNLSEGSLKDVESVENLLVVEQENLLEMKNAFTRVNDVSEVLVQE